MPQVIADGRKFIFHLVPSGIMYSDKTCVVGNGVVFDCEQFLREVDELNSFGISVDNRLFVSDLTHLVLPYHKAQDNAAESNMGQGKIGTTGRGIGPAYSDKTSRTGLRVGDLQNWDFFAEKFSANFALKKKLIESVYQSKFDLSLDYILSQYKMIRERMLPFIADTGFLIFDASRKENGCCLKGHRNFP